MPGAESRHDGIRRHRLSRPISCRCPGAGARPHCGVGGGAGADPGGANPSEAWAVMDRRLERTAGSALCQRWPHDGLAGRAGPLGTRSQPDGPWRPTEVDRRDACVTATSLGDAEIRPAGGALRPEARCHPDRGGRTWVARPAGAPHSDRRPRLASAGPCGPPRSRRPSSAAPQPAVAGLTQPPDDRERAPAPETSIASSSQLLCGGRAEPTRAMPRRKGVDDGGSMARGHLFLRDPAA
jgi:hypothetical protein